MFVVDLLSGHDGSGTRTLEMSIDGLHMNQVYSSKQGEKTKQY